LQVWAAEGWTTVPDSVRRNCTTRAASRRTTRSVLPPSILASFFWLHVCRGFVQNKAKKKFDETVATGNEGPVWQNAHKE
jgi:hypothetical protein